MQGKNHLVLVTARNKDVTHNLLKSYNIKYIDRGKGGTGLITKMIYLIRVNQLLLKLSLRFKPDIFLSFASPYAAQVSWVIQKPHITLTDTEHAKLGLIGVVPFSDVVITPQCFIKDLGKKHQRLDSYMELFYLHPKYFKPAPNALKSLGVSEGEKFIILRFISWEASHDSGQIGLSGEMKRRAVKELSNFGKVFISSEGDLPKDLIKYQIKIPPEKMHDVLYYASLFFGESGTMATEAAILGTPSVRVSSLAKYLGNFKELSEKYKLIFYYDNGMEGLNKSIEILKNENSKKDWQQKSRILIQEKISITDQIVKLIEKKGQK
jgi:hypothetical protein